jgi:flagellar motor protein MotB
MNARRGYPIVATIAAAVAAAVSPNAAPGQTADIKGSADHPVISRYAESTIVGYEVRKFDEFVLPLGPVTVQGTPPKQTLAPTKSERLEGKITRLLYVVPPERTTFEVLRNYELELTKTGFTSLYSCALTDCGRLDAFVDVVYSRRQLPNGPFFLFPAEEPRYLAARRSTPTGTTHISLFVESNRNGGDLKLNRRVAVLLDVIESAAMDTGMVTVDAAAMAKEITTTGHVALYGILFDFNKADVKPESEPALREIAALIKGQPQLKLLVVGHTDSVGGYDANMLLSDRRAAAVLKELTTKYGVAANRLRAVGVGMAAPVAPNESEDGRSKNRRVELVKQ